MAYPGQNGSAGQLPLFIGLSPASGHPVNPPELSLQIPQESVLPVLNPAIQGSLETSLFPGLGKSPLGAQTHYGAPIPVMAVAPFQPKSSTPPTPTVPSKSLKGQGLCLSSTDILNVPSQNAIYSPPGNMPVHVAQMTQYSSFSSSSSHTSNISQPTPYLGPLQCIGSQSSSAAQSTPPIISPRSHNSTATMPGPPPLQRMAPGNATSPKIHQDLIPILPAPKIQQEIFTSCFNLPNPNDSPSKLVSSSRVSAPGSEMKTPMVADMVTPFRSPSLGQKVSSNLMEIRNRSWDPQLRIENVYSKRLTLFEILLVIEKKGLETFIASYEPVNKDFSRAMTMYRSCKLHNVTGVKANITEKFYESLVSSHISVYEVQVFKEKVKDTQSAYQKKQLKSPTLAWEKWIPPKDLLKEKVTATPDKSSGWRTEKVPVNNIDTNPSVHIISKCHGVSEGMSTIEARSVQDSTFGNAAGAPSEIEMIQKAFSLNVGNTELNVEKTQVNVGKTHLSVSNTQMHLGNPLMTVGKTQDTFQPKRGRGRRKRLAGSVNTQNQMEIPGNTQLVPSLPESERIKQAFVLHPSTTSANSRAPAKPIETTQCKTTEQVSRKKGTSNNSKPPAEVTIDLTEEENTQQAIEENIQHLIEENAEKINTETSSVKGKDKDIELEKSNLCGEENGNRSISYEPELVQIDLNTCYLCGEMFRDSPESRCIWAHIREKHVPENKLKEINDNVLFCTHCFKEAPDFGALEKHEREVHLLDKHCFFCGLSIPGTFSIINQEDTEYWKHVIQCHCILQVCGNCDGKFTTLNGFHEHCKESGHNPGKTDSTQGNFLICPFCQIKYVSRKSLVCHLSTIHLLEDKPDKDSLFNTKYKCIACESNFLTQEALDFHLSLTAKDVAKAPVCEEKTVLQFANAVVTKRLEDKESEKARKMAKFAEKEAKRESERRAAAVKKTESQKYKRKNLTLKEQKVNLANNVVDKGEKGKTMRFTSVLTSENNAKKTTKTSNIPKKYTEEDRLKRYSIMFDCFLKILSSCMLKESPPISDKLNAKTFLQAVQYVDTSVDVNEVDSSFDCMMDEVFCVVNKGKMAFSFKYSLCASCYGCMIDFEAFPTADIFKKAMGIIVERAAIEVLQIDPTGSRLSNAEYFLQVCLVVSRTYGVSKDLKKLGIPHLEMSNALMRNINHVKKQLNLEITVYDSTIVDPYTDRRTKPIEIEPNVDASFQHLDYEPFEIPENIKGDKHKYRQFVIKHVASQMFMMLRANPDLMKSKTFLQAVQLIDKTVDYNEVEHSFHDVMDHMVWTVNAAGQDYIFTYSLCAVSYYCRIDFTKVSSVEILKKIVQVIYHQTVMVVFEGDNFSSVLENVVEMLQLCFIVSRSDDVHNQFNQMGIAPLEMSEEILTSIKELQLKLKLNKVGIYDPRKDITMPSLYKFSAALPQHERQQLLLPSAQISMGSVQLHSMPVLAVQPSPVQMFSQNTQLQHLGVPVQSTFVQIQQVPVQMQPPVLQVQPPAFQLFAETQILQIENNVEPPVLHAQTRLQQSWIEPASKPVNQTENSTAKVNKQVPFSRLKYKSVIKNWRNKKKKHTDKGQKREQVEKGKKKELNEKGQKKEQDEKGQKKEKYRKIAPKIQVDKGKRKEPNEKISPKVRDKTPSEMCEFTPSKILNVTPGYEKMNEGKKCKIFDEKEIQETSQKKEDDVTESKSKKGRRHRRNSRQEGMKEASSVYKYYAEHAKQSGEYDDSTPRKSLRERKSRNYNENNETFWYFSDDDLVGEFDGLFELEDEEDRNWKPSGCASKLNVQPSLDGNDSDTIPAIESDVELPNKSDEFTSDNFGEDESEKNLDKSEKLTDKSEELTSKSEQFTDKSEELTGESEQFIDKSVKLTDKTEKITAKSVKFTDTIEKNKENSEKLTHNSETLTDKSEKFTDKSDQSINESDKFTDKTEKFTSITQKRKRKEDDKENEKEDGNKSKRTKTEKEADFPINQKQATKVAQSSKSQHSSPKRKSEKISQEWCIEFKKRLVVEAFGAQSERIRKRLLKDDDVKQMVFDDRIKCCFVKLIKIDGGFDVIEGSTADDVNVAGPKRRGRGRPKKKSYHEVHEHDRVVTDKPMHINEGDKKVNKEPMKINQADKEVIENPMKIHEVDNAVNEKPMKIVDKEMSEEPVKKKRGRKPKQAVQSLQEGEKNKAEETKKERKLSPKSSLPLADIKASTSNGVETNISTTSSNEFDMKKEELYVDITSSTKEKNQQGQHAKPTSNMKVKKNRKRRRIAKSSTDMKSMCDVPPSLITNSPNPPQPNQPIPPTTSQLLIPFAQPSYSPVQTVANGQLLVPIPSSASTVLKQPSSTLIQAPLIQSVLPMPANHSPNLTFQTGIIPMAQMSAASNGQSAVTSGVGQNNYIQKLSNILQAPSQAVTTTGNNVNNTNIANLTTMSVVQSSSNRTRRRGRPPKHRPILPATTAGGSLPIPLLPLTQSKTVMLAQPQTLINTTTICTGSRMSASPAKTDQLIRINPLINVKKEKHDNSDDTTKTVSESCVPNDVEQLRQQYLTQSITERSDPSLRGSPGKVCWTPEKKQINDPNQQVKINPLINIKKEHMDKGYESMQQKGLEEKSGQNSVSKTNRQGVSAPSSLSTEGNFVITKANSSLPTSGKNIPVMLSLDQQVKINPLINVKKEHLDNGYEVSQQKALTGGKSETDMRKCIEKSAICQPISSTSGSSVNTTANNSVAAISQNKPAMLSSDQQVKINPLINVKKEHLENVHDRSRQTGLSGECDQPGIGKINGQSKSSQPAITNSTKARSQSKSTSIHVDQQVKINPLINIKKEHLDKGYEKSQQNGLGGEKDGLSASSQQILSTTENTSHTTRANISIPCCQSNSAILPPDQIININPLINVKKEKYDKEYEKNQRSLPQPAGNVGVHSSQEKSNAVATFSMSDGASHASLLQIPHLVSSANINTSSEIKPCDSSQTNQISHVQSSSTMFLNKSVLGNNAKQMHQPYSNIKINPLINIKKEKHDKGYEKQSPRAGPAFQAKVNTQLSTSSVVTQSTKSVLSPVEFGVNYQSRELNIAQGNSGKTTQSPAQAKKSYGPQVDQHVKINPLINIKKEKYDNEYQTNRQPTNAVQPLHKGVSMSRSSIQSQSIVSESSHSLQLSSGSSGQKNSTTESRKILPPENIVKINPLINIKKEKHDGRYKDRLTAIGLGRPSKAMLQSTRACIPVMSGGRSLNASSTTSVSTTFTSYTQPVSNSSPSCTSKQGDHSQIKINPLVNIKKEQHDAGYRQAQSKYTAQSRTSQSTTSKGIVSGTSNISQQAKTLPDQQIKINPLLNIKKEHIDQQNNKANPNCSVQPSTLSSQSRPKFSLGNQHNGYPRSPVEAMGQGQMIAHIPRPTQPDLAPLGGETPPKVYLILNITCETATGVSFVFNTTGETPPGVSLSLPQSRPQHASALMNLQALSGNQAPVLQALSGNKQPAHSLNQFGEKLGIIISECYSKCVKLLGFQIPPMTLSSQFSPRRSQQPVSQLHQAFRLSPGSSQSQPILQLSPGIDQSQLLFQQPVQTNQLPSFLQKQATGQSNASVLPQQGNSQSQEVDTFLDVQAKLLYQLFQSKSQCP
ncbi:hypothetical protein MAR_014259 [Mya arenaria]|uniref:C2H2-type domain-containing protein n=1 Tax=Mya arenaria TaxID=6604 RepID=A0ABY7G275_MYAAR|nr:hypothetical protein MAR_014259 [Mya arenaria]